ncbi:ABC transporter ATP-binding protein [Caldichromatium japonicum]|uniref:ABC transporter ATP-binding protein n=1 Tax=Caldichromatium japonicum TaxID=2699430 RepID=A0A6G7VA16_9GAMM|nr:ABC transporter ATP-binding protein [Caldichromatium japonicum]QIK36802.1 ABC transporter ATP-binding protein [Caldichromatium japonicum]
MNSRPLPPGALRIQGLGKAYKRYARKWDRAGEWLGLGVRHRLHWVLRDIDLQVDPGEAVGIIGVNGAGKSTLLKLIAGITQPTTGTIERGGRLSALLELGIGFHGELTGRENLWSAGALAGLDGATLSACLSEIAAFADIGDYLDQPVRTYSSGMQVRLAFALATAVRPDLLIVDEALAVGDLFFQQRCFERIRAFRAAGTTLLFVSHAMSTVYALCDRAILIEGGRIIQDGEPRRVIDVYNASIANRLGSGDLRIVTAGPGAGSYDRGDVRIEQVQVLHQGQPVQTLVSDSLLTVRIEVRFLRDLQDPHVGFQVRDRRGEAIYMTHTHGLGLRIGPVRAGERIEVCFSFIARLIPGDYSFTVGVADGGLPGGHLERSLTRFQEAAQFSLTRNLQAAHWDGICNLEPSCQIQRL